MLVHLGALGRFFDGHFFDGHFFDGRFSTGHFIDWTVYRQDIFSTYLFSAKYFHIFSAKYFQLRLG